MKRLTEAWNQFWFTPESTATLALVRIAFGLVTLGWTLSLIPDVLTFFGPHGLVTPTLRARGPGVWSLFDFGRGTPTVIAVITLLLASAVSLIVGFRSRLASAVAFICLLSFSRRDPFVFNSGDALLRVIAFYLMLSPSGESLSLDRWAKDRDDFWTFPRSPQWPLRLFQVQLSVLYLAAVWAKLQGPTWNDGTAVYYALHIADLSRLVPPTALKSILLANLLTYGTLAIEFSLGVLVWNKTFRPWVLGLGLLLHLGIDLAVRVGFFGLTMAILYIAFLSPSRMDDRLIRVQRWLLHRRKAVGVYARAESLEGN